MEEVYTISVLKNGIEKNIEIKFEVGEYDTFFTIGDDKYLITNSNIEDFFIYLSGCMYEENA